MKLLAQIGDFSLLPHYLWAERTSPKSGDDTSVSAENTTQPPSPTHTAKDNQL